jgi:uncharacterized protein (TIGR02058 family)
VRPVRDPLFIELGMGADLRGADATKAARRAVRNAIDRNLLPGIYGLLKGGGRMAVHARLAVPAGTGPVDIEAVRAEFPAGDVTIEVVQGGMVTPNGLADGGNALIVNAAVEVGIVR